MGVPQFSYPSIGCRTGSFQIGVIMCNTPINIYLHIFLWTYVFSSLGKLGSGIGGSFIKSIYNFKRNCEIFPKWQVHFAFPQQCI